MNKNIEKRMLKMFDGIETLVKQGYKISKDAAPVLWKEVYRRLLAKSVAGVILSVIIGIAIHLLISSVYTDPTERVLYLLEALPAIFLIISGSTLINLIVSPTLTMLETLKASLIDRE